MKPHSMSARAGVSPNVEITVARDLKFHWYLRTLILKLQKAKAESPQESPYTQFPSLGIFINKKVGFQKN